MEKRANTILYQDFGSGDDSRWLSRFPLLLQPVCGGLPQVLTDEQFDLWGEVLNLLDRALLSVKILGQGTEYLPKPRKGKQTVLKTTGGDVKLSRVIEQPLTGLRIVCLDDGSERQDYSKSRMFKRALSALDFIFNYWIVCSESQKFTRGIPLCKQFLLSDLLAPIIPLLCYSTTDHISIFKFCTVFPLAAARTFHRGPNVLPQAPIVYNTIREVECCITDDLPWYVFKNQFGKRIKSLVQGKATIKTIKFCHDLQETKRGCPVVPSDFVEEALRKHQKALSKPFDHPVGGEIEEILYGDSRPRVPCPGSFGLRSHITESRLLAELPRVMEFLNPAFFPGRKLSPRDWVKCYPASTKACFENFSVLGGSREYLRTLIFEEFGLTVLSSGLHTMYETRTDGAKEIRTAVLVPDRDIMTFLWEKETIREGPCYSQVKEILEPLKVRVITKSNALPQYLSIPVQKALHGALRKRKIFQLLNEPISGLLINDFVDRNRDQEGAWNSGDYKGATDGLSQEISEIVARSVIGHIAPWMSPKELHVLLRNLVGQKIKYVYHDEYGIPEEVIIDQANGQLMGSILSFPVLCLVNYLTYFFSVSPLFLEYERYVLGLRGALTSLELDRELVLINGDDILFKSSDSEYSRWEKTLSFFGFTLSVGKNLRSEKFLMINSCLFTRTGSLLQTEDHNPKRDFFIEATYPNLGLLKGRSKVSSTDHLVDDKPLWTIDETIRDGFGPNYARYYRVWNKERLQKYSNCGQRNYYGPRELGFCGLYDPNAVFTTPQLAWATAIHRKITTYGEQDRAPPGLRARDQMVQSVSDTWNDCSGPQPKMGLYIPRRCPTPPGYTDALVSRERKFHPFDGCFGEEPKCVFFGGSSFPREYIPEEEALQGPRVLSLIDGFRFIRKSLIPEISANSLGSLALTLSS